MRKPGFYQKPQFRVYMMLLTMALVALTLLCACTSTGNPLMTVDTASTSITDPTSENPTEPSESETIEMITQIITETSDMIVENDTAVTEPGETVTAEPTEASFTWANPLSYHEAENVDHLRDPFILKAGDAWYMTGTLPPYGPVEDQEDRTKGVPLYKSTDLKTWEFIDYIIETPLESENKWYSERFWAPEIFCHNGKYYVTVNCCRLDGSQHGFLFAVSDQIEGPYSIMNPDAPFVLNNDAHLFVDDDGQVYLFGSGIWMAKLDLENLQLLSAPKNIIEPIPDSDAWNAARPNVGFEGPYVMKHDGKYYCFYSTWARGYEIGVAVAEDIDGPWTMYENPMYGAMSQERCDYYGGVYEDDYYLNQDKYRECGHNSVFEGPDGELWIAAHVTGGGVVNGVELVIDKLVFDDTYGLIAIDPDTGEKILGPTYGEQKVTYDPSAIEPKGVKALDVWVYTSVGEAYTLPALVDILMDNGFRRTAGVSWDADVDTNTEGLVTVTGTASLNGTTYPVKAFVLVATSLFGTYCDFEDLDVGTTDLGGKFGDVWSVVFTLYQEIGRTPAVIMEENGNKFLRNTAYLLAGLHDGALEDSYQFSVDWRILSSQTVGGVSERLGGIAVRSADMKLAHYEEDQNRLVGGSGIMLIPTEDGIRVAIKKYVADGSSYKVTSESVFFDVSLGNDFNNFEIIDTGDRITVAVNGETICCLELGDVGMYANSSYEYARAVKLLDAEGRVLLDVKDALVTAKKEIHIVARGWTCFDLDNICIEKV